MNIVVDSSVFVSAINPAEPQHAISRRFFESLSAKEGTVIIPWLVVLEVANTLARYGSLFSHFPNTERFFNRFDTYILRPIDEQFARQSIVFLPILKLTSADAIIAATAAINQAELISWNRQLLKSAQQIVAVRTPEEFLQEKTAR